LIKKAVELELHELLEQHGERRTADGRAGVVRSGYLPERELQTGMSHGNLTCVNTLLTLRQ
jgi:hypothetical protein